MSIEEIIKCIKSLEDLNTLRRIRKVVEDRIEEIRMRGNEWVDEAILELWDRLSEDQKRLIKYLAEKSGEALKSEILKEFGWKEMKPTGVIAGINTQARNMGFKDVVIRSDVRRNGGWDIKYKLNRNWLNFIQSL